MTIMEHQASDLTALVSEIVEIGRKVPKGRPLWFRGHQSSTYVLQPTIVRDGRPDEQVFKREERLLTRFRQRSLPFWPAGYPQNDWEHLFAMQHYGIPTRLLDWTENLFVAAYFALNGGMSKSAKSPVIWCFDPVKWNRSMPGLSEFGEQIHVLNTASEDIEPYAPKTKRKRHRSPVAIHGTHNSARIAAQRGTFVIWGKETDTMESVAERIDAAVLHKIYLTHDSSKLRDDLMILGFSETSVYPDLPALASEVARVEGWNGDV